MVTDSRSFMSYPRHEYFRRVLCNLVGCDVERGEIPDDDALLGPLVRNICHVATTEDIPAKLGVQFGYRYRLDGPQENAAVILTRVTRFPAPMKPPGGAAAQSVSEHNIQMRVGTVSYVGFGFDHDWEKIGRAHV